MSAEVVMKPENEMIKKDEFYLFYEMMIQSLKTDDVKGGLSKSFSMLRSYLNSGNIALYRKTENGIYVFKSSDSKMNELIQPIGCIINKTKPLIEQKKIFNLDLSLSSRLQNAMFFHLNLNDNDDECIFVIINNNEEKELEPHFWDRLRDTMNIILKRAVSYERNTKAITTDLLTGLDNRNSYEMKLQSIDENDGSLVLGIFDLFRLKHINDNYTHTVGDEYIKKAAKILAKYWPKCKIKINDDGTQESHDTGHCVYRFGGDEFILLTNVEKENLATLKAELAANEAEMIQLGLNDDCPLGLNYGFVTHNPGDSIKKTVMRADDIMQKDKDKMYQKYHLERRH